MSGLSKWKLALYLVALFAAGGVSGWVVAAKMAKERAFAPPRFEEYVTKMRTQLRDQLLLTDAQQKELDAIFEQNSKEMNAAHGDLMKRIRAGMSNRTARINAILNPEQQKKFEALEKERMDQWRRKGRDGKDGRDGPREGRRGPGSRGGTNAAPEGANASPVPSPSAGAEHPAHR